MIVILAFVYYITRQEKISSDRRRTVALEGRSTFFNHSGSRPQRSWSICGNTTKINPSRDISHIYGYGGVSLAKQAAVPTRALLGCAGPLSPLSLLLLLLIWISSQIWATTISSSWPCAPVLGDMSAAALFATPIRRKRACGTGPLCIVTSGIGKYEAESRIAFTELPSLGDAFPTQHDGINYDLRMGGDGK